MSNKMDLREEVDAYNRKHGRITEGAEGYRNFLNAVYTSPAFLRRLPQWKEQQRKQELNKERPKPLPAADIALANEWLAFRNEEIRKHNASLTTGVGLPPLEIGYSNGQISMDSAIQAARQWHQDKLDAYDDRVTAAGRARVQYIQAENERVNRLLHQPIDPNDSVYLKYKIRLTPLTDQQIDDYSNWNVVDLRRGIDHTKYQAALEINLNGELSPHEWACLTRWVQTNNLDPMGAENWITGALILTELSVIRPKDLGPVTVDIEPPKLPEAVERPVAESRPTGRAAEQAQREADALADIVKSFGSYLDEVNSKQAEPVAPAILFQAYDTMLKTRQTLDRQTIRKALFYAAIAKGQRLDGFDDAEIESWASDQPAMHQMSSDEYLRQVRLYGDARLHRVPNKQTALLEQLVKNTTRKL